MSAHAGDESPRLHAALAHDLRTPLGAIQAWAQFLQSHLGAGDPQAARALEGILAGVEQQRRLIDAAARER